MRKVSSVAPEVVAGRIMPRLREDSTRLMRAYGTTRKLSKYLGLRRADAQDLLILQLIAEKIAPKRATKIVPIRKKA